MKTKGQLEAEISQAIVKFERDYMGRGPEDVRTYLLDVIIFSLKDPITFGKKNG